MQVLPSVAAQISALLMFTHHKTGLWHHPDADFTQYILEGLQQDFHIGASTHANLQSANTNVLSARLHPNTMEEYLLSGR